MSSMCSSICSYISNIPYNLVHALSMQIQKEHQEREQIEIWESNAKKITVRHCSRCGQMAIIGAGRQLTREDLGKKFLNAIEMSKSSDDCRTLITAVNEYTNKVFGVRLGRETVSENMNNWMTEEQYNLFKTADLEKFNQKDLTNHNYGKWKKEFGRRDLDLDCHSIPNWDPHFEFPKMDSVKLPSENTTPTPATVTSSTNQKATETTASSSQRASNDSKEPDDNDWEKL